MPPNNTRTNNNIEQDEYGLNGTLLFLPSTVHYNRLNRNSLFPNIFNSMGGIFSNIAGATLNTFLYKKILSHN